MTHPTEPRDSVSPGTGRVLAVVAVVLAIAAAIAIRVVWPWENVMSHDVVWFRGMDAYYHMRMVDNLIANFPHETAWDPFTAYPTGMAPPFHPLTGWLIAVPALVLGGGAPSMELVDLIGAFFPVVLGALTIIPVYLIGSALFGRLAGASAAVILAVLPGEFLSRSLLGFADHHATEALFSTCTLLFLVLATRRVTEKGITLTSFRASIASGERRAYVLALLAGLSLGLYLLAWRGGVLLLLVVFAYIATRAIVDYARGREGDDVIIVCSTAVIIGGAMVLPIVSSTWTPALFVAALLAAALSPVVLKYMSRFARGKGWSTGVFVGALVALGLAAIAVAAIISPSTIGNAYNAIDFMIPTGESLSITEMHPLFLPGGDPSLRPACTNFVTVLPLSILALAVLLRDRRKSKNEVILFAVWSIVMLVAVLSQRRFGYYYAGSAAMLTGYLIARLWDTDWVTRRVHVLRRHAQSPARAHKKSERRALTAQRQEQRSAALGLSALAVALVLVLVVPSVNMARNFATERSLMTDSWAETLEWLSENTDEPMGPDAYHELYDRPHGGRFDYPDSAYSIVAWWDYGHWLTRVARRMPVCNPFQTNAKLVAEYLLSKEEAGGEEYLETLDTRYLVLDARTAVTSFHGVALWNGEHSHDYYDKYQQRTPSGDIESIVLYYPEYHQTMLARLFAFTGEQVLPQQYEVIHYEVSGRIGDRQRTITGLEQFSTYEEAAAYVEDSDDPNTALVSTSPFESCIPLEAMDGYSVVFESSASVTILGTRIPEVRVFEYSGTG